MPPEILREELPIVLTGTIIPNAPFTAHNDPEIRRQEYLTAINFYRQFAPVYFLENSTYALESDAEFQQWPNVLLRKCPVSDAPERGKGYQEFQMIDHWLLSEPQPPRHWMKITGRYLYRNIAMLLSDCCCGQNIEMVIDQCPRSKKARGYLFCIETDFYRKYLAGAYRDAHDLSGEWIEYVLYRRLNRAPATQVRLFAVEPRLSAVSGSTGGDLGSPPMKFAIKKVLRRVNFLFDKRRLWYTH